MSKDIFALITLFFIGALVVLVVTHAKGFATSAGTLFTGIQGMGNTLTGANIKGGQ